jgi:outer membrane immunogenic protein
MKRTFKPICFALLTLSLMNARAESENSPWVGAYGQLGAIGYGSYMPKQSTGTTTALGQTVQTTFISKRINGYIGNISAGYYFDLNQPYLLGIGATLYPGKSKSADTAALAPGLPTSHGTYDIADIYSIYLTPGYALNKHQFIYGKVGYTEATVHSSAQGNLLGGNYPEQTSHMNGIVYGFGYKQIISDSIYLFGEFNYAVDKPKQVSITTPDSFVINSTAKASGYDFVFGVGYRF